MTREDAIALYHAAAHDERAAEPRHEYRRATAYQLRELAAAKRSTANALDVLASFVVEGER